MSAQAQSYQHWHLNEDDTHILWLGFDRKDTAVNTIDQEVLAELEQILAEVQQGNLAGLVIYSSKEKGFIAGADVHAFSKIKDLQVAQQFVSQGQQRCNQLASLSIPTVAMIDGFCLGGGLEFALSCRYRIAVDNIDTRLGFPEVKLGIIPAWGGIHRLIKAIGVVKAFDLILSGKIIRGNKAKKLGIIDAVVPKRHIKSAARYYLQKQQPTKSISFFNQLINRRKVRSICSKIIQKKLNQKVNPSHYPAPYKIVTDWEAVGCASEQLEKKSVKTIESLLLDNNTAKNLIRVFMLREKLKKTSAGIKFLPQRVHVVGSGVMGGDIAAWCVLQGLTVSLQDREAKFIASALKRAYHLFTSKLRKPHLIQAAMDRLIPDLTGQSISKAQVIIEAVSEDLTVKQGVLKEVEALAQEDALIATNTSSLPLKEISKFLDKPQRLIGIHFFNPVAKMHLVEVIEQSSGSSEFVQRACAFINKLNRLPVVVKSKPGFLINRILMPYLMEAIYLMEEGTEPAIIDKNAVDFGMPMGPIELADTVGLDVCLAVAKNLTLHYSNVTIPAKLQQMVNDGKVGRKRGQGFYQYRKGKLIPSATTKKQPVIDNQAIIDRLIMSILNESVACLREEIVQDDDALDAAMVYGTGFAPFRGGPIEYIKSVGTDKIERQLQQLAQQYGERFIPDKYLSEL